MKFKILLIEDDPPTIELYKEIFSLPEFDLEIVNYCFEGIEILREIRERKRDPPKLVLLDLILPDENGINFLLEAKKYPETRNLKIFALTNYTDPELEQELIKQGIDKILLKTSCTPKELIKIVKNSLEKG